VKELSWDQVRAFRLARHGLVERRPVAELVDIARRVCGLQAQVPSAAELQLWARLVDLKPTDVRRALWEDRTLVRTWAMRGTLHLLAADDLPVYVAALRTHDRWWKGAWLRMVGCSADELKTVLGAIAASLTGDPVTREQLADAVASRTGPHLRDRMLSGWAAMLKPAAFDGALISGPPQGQNVTFVRPDKWLAQWQEPSAEDAWRQIVRRYLRAYGPASREEFARWWGMQPATAGRVLRASADELVEVSVEGSPEWALRDDVEALAGTRTSDTVQLLPAFDVYTIGTRPRHALVDKQFEDRVFREAGWISPVVLIDGRVAGVWSHQLERKHVAVEVELFRPPTSSVTDRVATEVDRLGQFFEAEATLSYKA
jgi:hypothetical protein